MEKAAFGVSELAFEVVTAAKYAKQIGRPEMVNEIEAIAKAHGNQLGRHKDSHEPMFSNRQLFKLCLANGICPVVRGVEHGYPIP